MRRRTLLCALVVCAGGACQGPSGTQAWSRNSSGGSRHARPPRSGETAADADGDGIPAEDDCDDHDAGVHYDAPERCRDGVDNDCDGIVDEPCSIVAADGILTGSSDQDSVDAVDVDAQSCPRWRNDEDGDGHAELEGLTYWSTAYYGDVGRTKGVLRVVPSGRLVGANERWNSAATTILTESDSVEATGTAVPAGDIDADGFGDFIAQTEVSDDEFYWSDEAGWFVHRPYAFASGSRALGQAANTEDVATAYSENSAAQVVLSSTNDLSGDGIPDLVSTGGSADDVLLSLVDGVAIASGASMEEAELASIQSSTGGSGIPSFIGLNDIDGDGVNEVWLRNLSADGLSQTWSTISASVLRDGGAISEADARPMMRLGTGVDVLPPTASGPMPYLYAEARAKWTSDLDGDGYLDVVLVDRNEGPVALSASSDATRSAGRAFAIAGAQFSEFAAVDESAAVATFTTAGDLSHICAGAAGADIDHDGAADVILLNVAPVGSDDGARNGFEFWCGKDIANGGNYTTRDACETVISEAQDVEPLSADVSMASDGSFDLVLTTLSAGGIAVNYVFIGW